MIERYSEFGLIEPTVDELTSAAEWIQSWQPEAAAGRNLLGAVEDAANQAGLPAGKKHQVSFL